LSISVLLVVFYTMNISHDYPSYIIFNQDIQVFDSLIKLIYSSRFEPGFIAISYFLSSFFSASGVFIVLASISLIIKYVLFKKYLNTPNFAL
jgi:hypothetical protein